MIKNISINKMET